MSGYNAKKCNILATKIASDYSLSREEALEIEQLIEGLILHLLEETDSLIPAFIVSDLDVSFYDAKMEMDCNNEWHEESPSGYEVNDYNVDFVRNPDNHELVISYRQLIDKMREREYPWDWQDLTKSERECIQRVLRNYINNHDWIEVDKTYVYDDSYTDVIVTEGKSKIKLGVKCESEFFTIFVLKARPSEEPLETAVDWLAERMYKKKMSENEMQSVVKIKSTF